MIAWSPVTQEPGFLETRCRGLGARYVREGDDSWDGQGAGGPAGTLAAWPGPVRGPGLPGRRGRPAGLNSPDRTKHRIGARL